MKIVDFKDFVKYPSVFVGLWRKEKTIYAEEGGYSRTPRFHVAITPLFRAPHDSI